VSSRRIAVFDTTLRDGEQSPGIALQPDEKAAIAGQLERLGVDAIEAGFAAASPGDFEGVRAVAREVRSATVASMCRARREDVDAAAAALAGARRSRVHVVLGTSPIHMERKLGLTPDEVVSLAVEVVEHARGRVDEVEFCCEDATRSEPAFVARVCAAVVEAGAHVVNLPDTVRSSSGCSSPRTATTTSASPSPTRSPRSARASTRSR
jgi:2-isopropylmalate synthase